MEATLAGRAFHYLFARHGLKRIQPWNFREFFQVTPETLEDYLAGHQRFIEDYGEPHCLSLIQKDNAWILRRYEYDERSGPSEWLSTPGTIEAKRRQMIRFIVNNTYLSLEYNFGPRATPESTNLLGRLLAFLGLGLLASCGMPVPGKTVGMPIGASFRAADVVATLIRTEVSRIPEVPRRPENDRYNLDLVLHRGTRQDRVVRVADRLPFSAFGQSARFLGANGSLLWFQTDQERVYDLEQNRLLSPAEVGAAPRPQRPILLSQSGSTAPEYEQGLLLSPTAWMGLFTPEEAAQHTRIGLPPITASALPRAWRPRHLYRGALNSRRLASVSEPASEPYLNGYFLKSEMPLVVHYSKSFLAGGHILITRLDQEGKAIWTADTGMGDLDQVLPDPKLPAFVGRVPRIPDKVQDPLLVFLDLASGKATIHSLRF
ncbi:MAG: hypothetical protein OHK0021_06500 [Bryobacter sp.]